MQIKIVTTPPGEAPEEMRAAWVGLTFPAIRTPVSIDGVGGLAHLKLPSQPGYLVPGALAVELLQQQWPEAASWWRENAPDATGPEGFLFLDLESCRRVPPRGSLPDDLLPAIIEEYSERLASYAYEGYQDHGRGVVQIFKPDDSDPEHAGLLGFEYFPLPDLPKQEPSVLTVIEGYNPETEIVIRFFREDGQIRTIRLRFESPSTPREMWEAMKAEDEET
jgi:hypothetical protein